MRRSSVVERIFAGMMLASMGCTSRSFSGGGLNASEVAVRAVGEPSGDSGRATASGAIAEALAPALPTSDDGVSLDLRDADIRDVLRLLGEVGHVNVVASDDVVGSVTIHLATASWDEAFSRVTEALGLVSHRDGDTVRVATALRLRDQQRAALEAQQAAAAMAPLRELYLHPSFAKATSLAAVVSGGGERSGREGTHTGLLSDRGIVIADAPSNTLIVRDVVEALDRVRTAVDTLDVAVPQILIESSIVEAGADLSESLGVQWGYRQAPSGGPTIGGGMSPSGRDVPFIVDFPTAANATGGSAFDLGLGSIDGVRSLDLRLTALAREGRVRIVSRPRVVTLNNTAATIKSLTVIRVKLPSSGTVVSTSGNSHVVPSVATEKIETGIILVVTPQVAADGRISLEMFAKSSQADFTHAVDGIPTETSREATASVIVRDGETVVLGGIYTTRSEDKEDGVPYLRSIPVLGWLFRREDRQDRREDLLVFLTPRVLGAGATRVAEVSGPALQTPE